MVDRGLATASRYWLILSLAGLAFLCATPFTWLFGIDLYSYWVIDPEHPYATINDSLWGMGAFRYAPPVALVMYPLHLLPYPVLQALWIVLDLAALYYIAGRWFLACILFPPVWLDIAHGNITILMTAAMVAGVRGHTYAWAWNLLTKVTPGVGVLWHFFRRDWQGLGIALGTTLAIVAVSVFVQGVTIWREWIESLIVSERLSHARDMALPIATVYRVAAAIPILALAGWRNWPWLVPVAVTLAIPSIWWISFAPLVAVPFLRQRVDADVEVIPTDELAGKPQERQPLAGSLNVGG